MTIDTWEIAFDSSVTVGANFFNCLTHSLRACLKTGTIFTARGDELFIEILFRDFESCDKYFSPLIFLCSPGRC